MGFTIREINASLPEPGQLLDRSREESTIIYDRNGGELYKLFADQNRVYKSLDNYSTHTLVTTLAAEDSDFYAHKGLDWIGITRCSFLSFQNYVTKGKSGMLCGASTIPQQLVRRTLMYDIFGSDAFDRSTFWRTVKRKLREMLMTVQVEKTMTKDQMLEMYMNEIPLGGVNYGFEAGAKSLFNRSASELTLAESAVLAGVIQSPSRYNPINGTQPEMAEARKDYVLDQIWKHRGVFKEYLNYEITEEEINAAKDQEMVYTPGRINITAPHFVWHVKGELVEMYDLDMVERGGLRVTTTLDRETQTIAEETIRKGIPEKGHRFDVQNGAMVAITPQNGELVAMVGSIDYWNTEDSKIDGNVNVTTSIRQMGSAFKPLTYLTAFRKEYGPWLIAPDIEEFDFNYDAENWDEKFEGPMLAREALVKSRNISALNTIQLVGIDSVLETAEKLGITTLTHRNQYGLSLTLGAGGQKMLEHAYAFTVFANEGNKVPPVSILKVENSKGEVLYERPEPEPQRVFDEKEVYLLNWTLCDLGNFGDQLMNHLYQHNGRRFVCGKTGTTNGPRDLTTFLYHKNLVIGVWSGNNDNSILEGATSSTVPLPIASGFMKNSKILEKYPSKLYSRPGDIESVKVCKDTGLEENDGDCDTESSICIKDRCPEEDKREELKVCEDNGKIAKNEDAAEKFDLLEEIIFLDYEFPNEHQRDAYEEFLEDEEDYVFDEPDEGDCPLPLGPDNAPLIKIKSPGNGSSYSAGASISIKSEVTAMDKVSKVEYEFDGSDIGSVSSSPYLLTYEIPDDTSSGSYTIKATAIDNHGKKGTASISIKVTELAPDIDIDVSAPGSASKGDDVELKAEVSGDDADLVDEVRFEVDGPGGCDIWNFICE